MLKYIAKRLVFIVLTLLAISVVVFFLNANAPGDPVLSILKSDETNTQVERKLFKRAYNQTRKKLHLDLPRFYWSITTQAYPDTLYRIVDQEHINTLNRLIGQYGNWNAIDTYFKEALELERIAWKIDNKTIDNKTYLQLTGFPKKLLQTYQNTAIRNILEKSNVENNEVPEIQKFNTQLTIVKKAYQNIINTATPNKNYIPAFHFYGLNNQYHHWITRFMKFDFGISYQDSRQINIIIGERIFWTVLISLISIGLMYGISIPLGVLSAVKKGTKTDNAITTFLFGLYALPSFWVATLLVVLLSEVSWLRFLGISGLGNVPYNATWWETLGIRTSHLVIPIVCWTYPLLAYITRQMRGGMLDVLGQDYIRTARAKGLPEHRVVKKHARRNALLPIITLFANALPSLIAGSVVLEMIFSIPGMGKTLFDAIQTNDHPMIFTIVMLTALLTMIGYLIADVLYAIVDPRIKY